MQPWMTSNEINLISKYINSQTVMLEYGSGSSTTWFAKQVLSIDSIEHHEKWYFSVKNNIQDYHNAKIHHVVPQQKWVPSTEGTYEEFSSYVDFPLSLKKNFSFFLVDGRARVACCQMISENFPNSVIAFHDFVNRCNDGHHFYENALKYLSVIETSDSLAILKKK